VEEQDGTEGKKGGGAKRSKFCTGPQNEEKPLYYCGSRSAEDAGRGNPEKGATGKNQVDPTIEKKKKKRESVIFTPFMEGGRLVAKSWEKKHRKGEEVLKLESSGG